MSDEITVRCTKCGQSAFRFSLQLLELKGEVICECSACNSAVRVRLCQDEVHIIA